MSQEVKPPAARDKAYATQDLCQESLERMTRRLTVDLRGKIRRLADHDCLTVDWLEMSDTLQHLSSVAVMEEKDAAMGNANNKTTGGQEGSVWEREELCIRILVEEGKINLLLRLLNTYKKFVISTPTSAIASVVARQCPVYGMPEVLQRMTMFEQGLGVLLRCSMTAVECLQTLDLFGLMDHIALVMDHSLSTESSFTLPPGGELLDASSVQEFVVFGYLYYLMRKIEHLSEDRVMGKLKDSLIVPKGLAVIEKFQRCGVLAKETLHHFIYFLGYTFETEAFKTHPTQFVISAEDRQKLCLLEASVKERMSADPTRRKTLRCVVDAIVRYK